MVELHLLLPEMPDSLPRETRVQAYCLRNALQSWLNLLIILKQVHSDPLQPQALSPESHWEQRHAQQAAQDKDDWLGCRSIHPLLFLATDSSLRLKDACTRPLREGFPLHQTGSCLISALTLVGKGLNQAAVQRDCCLWAALPFGCLIHCGVWVRAVTYLVGLIRWHRVQRMN